MTETPPLHPIEREQLQNEHTLVVTVRSREAFESDIRQSLTNLERGERVDSTPTLSFSSYDDLMNTLTPRVLDLIEVVRKEAPESINEAARVADRDVKNVHEELSELARLGIIYFEEVGQRKRPVVWFDELVIQLPFGSDSDDRIAALP